VGVAVASGAALFDGVGEDAGRPCLPRGAGVLVGGALTIGSGVSVGTGVSDAGGAVGVAAGDGTCCAIARCGEPNPVPNASAIAPNNTSAPAARQSTLCIKPTAFAERANAPCQPGFHPPLA